MSDLDLDAIRRRITRARRFLTSPDAHGLPDADHGHRAAYILATNDVPALLAEVERLKAHQQPDDGEWVTEYGVAYPGEGGGYTTSRIHTPHATIQRRVWYGPVTPIAEVSE